MKVLVLGDPDLSETNTFASLSREGVEIHLAHSPKWWAVSDPIAGNLIKREVTFKNRFDFNAIRWVRGQVHKIEYDIIHSLTNRALSCSLFATMGLNVAHVAYRGTVGHLSRFDPLSWLSYLNPRISKIVCVSNAVKHYLISLGVPEKRLVTIYKGHDPRWYQKSNVKSLAEFGVPPDVFVVGCVANMRPVKGVDFLIQGFEMVAPDLPIHLVLIGEVRDLNIQKLIAESPSRAKIHSLGFRSDATSLSGQFDVSVMPSIKREGLPKAVIEGMSQSVPAIVTNVGGMPELIRDGVEGFVVPPSNARVLADAIRKAYQDREHLKVMGAAAKVRIETAFSSSKTVLETLEMYRSVVTAARKPYPAEKSYKERPGGWSNSR